MVGGECDNRSTVRYSYYFSDLIEDVRFIKHAPW